MQQLLGTRSTSVPLPCTETCIINDFIHGRIVDGISSFPHPIFTLTLVVSRASPEPEDAGKGQRGRSFGATRALAVSLVSLRGRMSKRQRRLLTFGKKYTSPSDQTSKNQRAHGKSAPTIRLMLLTHLPLAFLAWQPVALCLFQWIFWLMLIVQFSLNTRTLFVMVPLKNDLLLQFAEILIKSHS